jgi:hypothetical protein
MKNWKIAFVSGLLLPLRALAYPIDVEIVTQGLDVDADSIQQGNGTVLNVINHEAVALRCDVLFNAGAESRRRVALLDPGGRTTVRYDPLRQVVRMRVRIECTPTGDDGGGEEG